MALELKIESLRARGELTAEERDRVLDALRGGVSRTAPARRRFLTPVRLFLLGVAVGVALAYFTWGWLSPRLF